MKKTKFVQRAIALCAALAMCLTLSACSSRREDTGVAYEKNMTITSAKDLEGKAVAVQLLSPADDYVVGNGLTAYPRRYENLENAVQDLLDKKVAVVVADANYAKTLVAGKEGVKIVDGSIASLQYCFRFGEEDAALAESLNEQIAALKESDDYNAMIAAEMKADGTHYAVSSGEDFEETAALVSQTGLRPFLYEEDGATVGFLRVCAEYLLSRCEKGLTVRTVYAGEVTETAAAGAQEHCFRVVTNPEAAEGFVDTDSFYTSELVMIIRDDTKKK